MTENNKPEWFEITDKDEKPELRKVSKSLPVSTVLVAALILGVGAVMGQTQNETPASAVTANAVQATDSQASPTSTAVSAVKSAVSNPVTAAVVGTAAASKLANPSISKLPTGSGDDDDDDDEDDDHGRGHHDDDEDDDDEDDD
jgi:phosphotransferase system  glucose/maltose/N-acetylglucosamine-specific IIC component